MMQVGNRIIYDQDGEIIVQLGEMQGNVLPRKEITAINFVDVEYGAINHQTHRIVGIDVKTKQPILQEILQQVSPEEQRIQELENQLLLAEDASVGGIL